MPAQPASNLKKTKLLPNMFAARPEKTQDVTGIFDDDDVDYNTRALRTAPAVSDLAGLRSAAAVNLRT